MTTSTIYKTKKVNSINIITCEIEETFMDNFSILVYDEENEIFIEKFANTYSKAVEIADSLFLNVCNKY
jgi:predicted nucleic acid-binding protein